MFDFVAMLRLLCKILFKLNVYNYCKQVRDAEIQYLTLNMWLRCDMCAFYDVL